MLDAPPLDRVVDTTDDDRPGHRRTAGPGLLAAVGVTVALVRWGFSQDRRVVHLIPDEVGILAMARWLGGATRWNMFDHSTYRPGLPLLLAPIYAVTDDAATVVRGTLAVNAVLGGLTAVVLVVLARRLTDLPPGWCAGIAVVVGVAPPALSASAYTWAEALVTLTFVTAVLLTIRALDTTSTGTAFAAVAVAAYGFAAHARLLPLVGSVVVLLAAGFELRSRRRAAAAIAGFGVVAVLAAEGFTRVVQSRVWDEPGEVNSADTVAERLDQPFAILDALTGQVWYQLASTLGLAGIGAAVVVRASRGRDDDVGTDRRSALVIIVATIPLVLLAATFLAGRDRPDQLIYGRYNDAILAPVVVLGMAWVAQRIRTGWTLREARLATGAALALAASALIVSVRHGDTLADDIGLRTMISGLLPFLGTTHHVDVVYVTTAALAAFALIAGATVLLHRSRSRGPAVAAVVVLVAALGLAAVHTYRGEARLLNGWTEVAAVRDIDALVPADADLAVLMVHTADDPPIGWPEQRQRYQLYQLYLPDRLFHRDRGLDDDVGPYVFAPAGHPPLVDAGATVVWDDPDAPLSLWREPTD